MEQLVKDFCAVPARKELYESVASEGRFSFKANASDGWLSQTVDGVTTIFHAPSDHPQACLGHELLHASLKNQGYKQFTVAVCLTAKQPIIARVLGALDNELQHHKFYDLFLSLGFSGTEMYHDDDSELEGYIRESVANLQGADTPLEEYFFLYLTLMAPGGSASDSKREDLVDLLESASPRRYWKRLVTIGENIGNLVAGPRLMRVLLSEASSNRSVATTRPGLAQTLTPSHNLGFSSGLLLRRKKSPDCNDKPAV